MQNDRHRKAYKERGLETLGKRYCHQGGTLRIMRSRTLDSVSDVELSRQAQVSRTTFYAHFNNVHEVFQALIGDYMADVQSLDGRLSDMRSHAPRPIPIPTAPQAAPAKRARRAALDASRFPIARKSAAPESTRPSPPTRGFFRSFFDPTDRSTGNSSPNDLPARAFRLGRSRRFASSK